MKFTINEFMSRLPLPAIDKWKDGVWDIETFNKGGFKLVFFAPQGTDYQTTHDEDEFYFIVRGSGELVIGEARHSFEAGDVFLCCGRRGASI